MILILLKIIAIYDTRYIEVDNNKESFATASHGNRTHFEA